MVVFPSCGLSNGLHLSGYFVGSWLGNNVVMISQQIRECREEKSAVQQRFEDYRSATSEHRWFSTVTLALEIQWYVVA